MCRKWWFTIGDLGSIFNWNLSNTTLFVTSWPPLLLVFGNYLQDVTFAEGQVLRILTHLGVLFTLVAKLLLEFSATSRYPLSHETICLPLCCNESDKSINTNLKVIPQPLTSLKCYLSDNILYSHFGPSVKCYLC